MIKIKEKRSNEGRIQYLDCKIRGSDSTGVSQNHSNSMGAKWHQL